MQEPRAGGRKARNMRRVCWLSGQAAPDIMLPEKLSSHGNPNVAPLPCSGFSEVNDILSNLLGWGELFQTTWCGSGGGARYTILAPTNKARMQHSQSSPLGRAGRAALRDHHLAPQPSLDVQLEITVKMTPWRCCHGSGP